MKTKYFETIWINGGRTAWDGGRSTAVDSGTCAGLPGGKFVGRKFAVVVGLLNTIHLQFIIFC